MKNIRFDLVMHWLYAIIWALLAVSGFAMIGAKFGWILNFNYIMTDMVHRFSAAAFVSITFIAVVYEIIRKIKKDNRPQPWNIIGRSGYQLFNLIITLLLILSGVLIWICMEFNMKAVAFAILVHEYISYLSLVSIIWHIYKKTHILIWPKKKVKQDII